MNDNPREERRMKKHRLARKRSARRVRELRRERGEVDPTRPPAEVAAKVLGKIGATPEEIRAAARRAGGGELKWKVEVEDGASGCVRFHNPHSAIANPQSA